MTYLATLRTSFHGCWIVHWNPNQAPKICPQKKLILAMSKCMVSMATHNAILLYGDVPTKITISQLVLSLDYQPWYQIKDYA